MISIKALEVLTSQATTDSSNESLIIGGTHDLAVLVEQLGHVLKKDSRKEFARTTSSFDQLLRTLRKLLTMHEQRRRTPKKARDTTHDPRRISVTGDNPRVQKGGGAEHIKTIQIDLLTY